MLKVGLTGGIGSGKSTAAHFFHDLGVPIIDADQIARELTQPGTVQFEKIVQHFGERILDSENKIDRKKLRQIIFHQADEKKWLEQCLHPPIIQIMCDRSRKIDYPYCILVIPLLTEIPGLDFIDRICVVDVDEETQRERAHQRDQAHKNEISMILDAQAKREKRLNTADDIIHNQGTLDQLRQQVHQLHQKYLQLG